MDKLLFFVGLLTVLLSCSSSDTQEPTSEIKKQTGVSVTNSRPDTIMTEFTIEGMTESMNMYLLESPEGFPLDFSTYVPVDMQTEIGHSDEGSIIHIWASFGGNPDKDAYLTIFGFPDEVKAPEAHKTAEEAARRVGDISVDSARYSWAETVFLLNGEQVGFLALAKERDHWIYLLAAYPPEYADGMGPRIDQIIQKWQWKDRALNKAD